MTHATHPVIRIDDDTEGVRVVAIGGALDVFSAGTLAGRALAGLPHDAHEFVIDLREVEFLDSAGLSAIVRMYQEACGRSLDVHATLSDESLIHASVLDALRGLMPCEPEPTV